MSQILGYSIPTPPWLTFSIFFAAVKLYHALLKEYGQRYEPIRPSLGILNGLGKALIILIGLLIAMDSLKISITPLLTTQGIGGLAVALACKDSSKFVSPKEPELC